ncbi:hypothetical protein [Paracoccus onubensis]|uniref:Uncharacterized protein n=1 Tax=Paracoccus onubensis TaxID=1675788 RepID=A0A418T3Q0_9RHOB|nr:hypothetical protein [Paracoccus onubensis]RJE87832.1 hypothetical protein D3P04_02580 [Paracoccus onubensis]
MTDGTKKDLYIHVGVHRTATTAIQATMFRNWKSLKDRGYLYPLGVERHIGVFNNILNNKKDARDVAAMLAQRAVAHETEIHTLIMSDEDISMRRDLSQLLPFREFFNVKIIFGMRRQDLWLESWWAQNVKGQWDRKLCNISWPDFMAGRAQFHWIDYDRYLAHLEKLFGQSNIRPYVFERTQMPRGPIAAFCRQFGLEGGEGLTTHGGSNISLCPEVSEFVRHLPLIEADMGVRLALIEVAEVVDRKVRAENGPVLLIPHDERRAIMKEYEAGNRNVARRYFGRDALFLEPLPDRREPVTTPALPGSSKELMERMMAPFLEEFVKRANKMLK